VTATRKHTRFGGGFSGRLIKLLSANSQTPPHSGGGWSTAIDNDQAMPISQSRPHLGGGFSVCGVSWWMVCLTWLANTSPLRWGFLHWVSHTCLALAMPRKHLPTSVGVILALTSPSWTRVSLSPPSWASFQPVPILYPTTVEVFALALPGFVRFRR